jgi:hypothetical protein
VFEGAWLDQRVKIGVADLVYDETSGRFDYRLIGRRDVVTHGASRPSFRAAAFHR